jgi:hypothetical protein
MESAYIYIILLVEESIILFELQCWTFSIVWSIFNIHKLSEIGCTPRFMWLVVIILTYFCVGYFTIPWVSRLVNNALERIRKDVLYYPGTCLEGLMKTTKYTSWDSCYHGWDLKQAPSKYKSVERYYFNPLSNRSFYCFFKCLLQWAGLNWVPLWFGWVSSSKMWVKSWLLSLILEIKQISIMASQSLEDSSTLLNIMDIKYTCDSGYCPL